MCKHHLYTCSPMYTCSSLPFSQVWFWRVILTCAIFLSSCDPRAQEISHHAIYWDKQIAYKIKAKILRPGEFSIVLHLITTAPSVRGPLLLNWQLLLFINLTCFWHTANICKQWSRNIISEHSFVLTTQFSSLLTVKLERLVYNIWNLFVAHCNTSCTSVCNFDHFYTTLLASETFQLWKICFKCT